MKSMTGFGRAETVLGNSQFTLEIKSVNHRFLDVRFRLPPSLTSLERELGDEVRSFCERGSLDITLKQKLASQKDTVQGNTRFVLDERALDSFLKAIKQLETKTQKKLDLSVSDALNTGKIFITVDCEDEKGPTIQDLLPCLKEALKSLVQMREQEGTALKNIMQRAISEMSGDLSQITELAKQQALKVREKLENRLSQWKLSEPVEPRRLEWEIALLAEKSDITEETDRLRGHFRAFLGTLDSPGAVGRKLDFLTQELNREVNTIASKTALIEITQLTVKLKSQIEKLREQVQNVE